MDTHDKDSITGQIKRGIDDVRDGAAESMHRSAADAEKTRREVDGDNMTLGEKVTSGANEAKHRLEAEGDKAKRVTRDNT